MAVISSATQVIPPAETRVANSQFTSQKIAQLDIIRGIAAVSVVYIHYGNYTSLVCFPGHEWIVKTVEVLSKIVQALSPQGGWAYSGVLIFICLSGFCIHLPNAGIGSGFDNGTGGGLFAEAFRAASLLPHLSSVRRGSSARSPVSFNCFSI